MPGKHSRTKGARIEREIVALHDEIGIPCEKVSRSGYTGPDFRVADTYWGESKARAGGFKLIERWIEGCELLFLRTDGKPKPLVVMPWDMYASLMRAVFTRRYDPPDDDLPF